MQLLPGSPTQRVYYHYNQRNLLVKTERQTGTGPTSPVADYRYDGANNRLQQVDHTGSSPLTTTYTNDILGLSQVLVSNDGTTETTHLFGLDLISQDDSTDTRYLLADGLGSVRTEMVGDTVETVTTYEPYGNLLLQTGTSGTVYGFTGEQEDTATGFVYLRARYYSPTLYSFTTKDSWPGNVNRPMSLHGYGYAYANPANLVDPSGHDAWWCDDRFYSNTPSYGWQDAISNCHVSNLPPTPTPSWVLELIPFARGFTKMSWASNQPGFGYEQQAYGRWQITNCPMGCHLSPESIESQYGANVWAWRGFPRPETPLMDLWGTGLAQTTHDTLAFIGIPLAQKYICSLAANSSPVPSSPGYFYNSFSNTEEAVNYYLSRLPSSGTMAKVDGPISAEVMSSLHANAASLGDEFALLLVDGEITLYRGRVGPFALPPGTTHVFAHTHPYASLVPSSSDIATLQALNQSRSHIITSTGRIIRFTKEGVIQEIYPPYLGLFDVK